MDDNTSKRKIGILGGTFNPVHIGHMIIAENAYDECCLDEVWLMPAHIPPHKRTDHILEDAVRFAMVQCAVADRPYMKASDFEIRRGSVSYTAETLKTLNRLYPDTDFYFIMGADSLYAIDRWYHPDEVFACARILVAARDEAGFIDLKLRADELKKQFNADICIMTVPRVEISSTMIRNRVATGHTINYFVPESVKKYIEQNRLYIEYA